MEQRFVCYDIDGTLTSDMLFVPLVQSEHDAGLLSDQSYDSILDTLKEYKKGEIAYEDAVQILLEKHASGLAGVRLDEISDNAVSLISNRNELFRPFGKKIIDILKDSSVQFAVTAEPQYLADAVSDSLQLDGAYATNYEVANGVFTGQIISSLANRQAKAELLLSHKMYAAFGDSEGDIGMLAAAQFPICINPSEELLKVAQAKDWTVIAGEIADILKVKDVLRFDN